LDIWNQFGDNFEEDVNLFENIASERLSGNDCIELFYKELPNSLYFNESQYKIDLWRGGSPLKELNFFKDSFYYI